MVRHAARHSGREIVQTVWREIRLWASDARSALRRWAVSRDEVFRKGNPLIVQFPGVVGGILNDDEEAMGSSGAPGGDLLGGTGRTLLLNRSGPLAAQIIWPV